MKKFFFALACVIGLMTFASCTQDVIDDIMAQKPEVAFVAEDGYISSTTSVYEGTELKFKVRVAPNSSSEAELDHFDFSITNFKTGYTLLNENPVLTDPNGENIFEWSITPDTASTYVVTATVTDKATPNAKVNAAEITVDYVKPVAAEMGVFTGNLEIQGHLTSNEIAGYEAYNMDTTLRDIPVTITLGALGDDNKVSATIDIEGTPVTLYGTLNPETNLITFEEFHFHKTINLYVDITLDLVMNMTGTLENDTMTLNGTAVGSGKTQILLATLEVNLDGTIGGTLAKQAE